MITFSCTLVSLTTFHRVLLHTQSTHPSFHTFNKFNNLQHNKKNPLPSKSFKTSTPNAKEYKTTHQNLPTFLINYPLSTINIITSFLK